MGSLEGKVVIVTGAAQGMGRSHAEWCVREGASVVATDLQVDLGNEVVAAIDGPAVFVEHDVTSEADWDRVIGAAVGHFGGLNGLVNNAAIYRGAMSIEDESFEVFARHLRINVEGTWWGIKKSILPMREAGGGSIVNISSISGLRGMIGHTSYGTSKWAVRGLTKTAAQDLGPLGIRVNSIHPGSIAGTGMYPRATPEETQRARLAQLPMRRAGSVNDISAMVAFLLSDVSTYITGVEHVVDGGAMLA